MKLVNKKGEEYTVREFLNQWKKGMQEITPLQQSTITQWGYIVSAIGIIWGIIFSFRLGYWWMAVILLGGMIVLLMQFLGNWQRKILLTNIENAITLSDSNFNLNKSLEENNGS